MKLLFSIWLLCMAGSLSAQSNADEAINKVIAALGGREKLLTIKTVRMTGNIEFSGQKIPFIYCAVDKKSQRTEFTFSGLTGYFIVRNDSGFNFNPFQGQTSPENMTAEDVKLAQPDLDQQSILVNYKQKGYEIEQLDKEDVDGVDALQLKITLSPNKTVYYFIDPSTYYIIRIKTVQVSNGQQQRNQVDYYDFKKTKDGYFFPHTYDNITFDNIEVNVPLDEKLFQPKR